MRQSHPALEMHIKGERVPKESPFILCHFSGMFGLAVWFGAHSCVPLTRDKSEEEDACIGKCINYILLPDPPSRACRKSASCLPRSCDLAIVNSQLCLALCLALCGAHSSVCRAALLLEWLTAFCCADSRSQRKGARARIERRRRRAGKCSDGAGGAEHGVLPRVPHNRAGAVPARPSSCGAGASSMVLTGTGAGGRIRRPGSCTRW